MKTNELEMAKFLLDRGWRRVSHPSPWQWCFKQFCSAFHTLQHAYDIEKAKRAKA